MPLFIEVKGLSKSFGDHTVIRNLNLEIEAGEVVVFQGASGIGKSTFLRCLTYLETFQAGRVHVGGLQFYANMDVHAERESIRTLRMQLGFVFQFFNLFPHLTVLQNLTLAPVQVLQKSQAEADEEALNLLKRVGLVEKAHAYPASLSGGQSQRVAIARALAMHPKAMLLDEPTSSLDPEMKQGIVDVIEGLTQDGLTTVIVTHEPAVIERIATRVIRFGPECTILADDKRPR